MITVRVAQAVDGGQIVEFQLRMASETEGLQLDRATVEQGVAAVFDDPSRGQYLVAEVDGQIAGSLLCLPEWSDWRNGTVLWIHSVYVRPEYRRKGVFGRMYESLRQKVLADKDLKGLRLYVDKGNVPAQEVYRALGMNGEHYQLFEWMK